MIKEWLSIAPLAGYTADFATKFSNLYSFNAFQDGCATVYQLPEVSRPPNAVIALLCEPPSPCPLRKSVTLHFHVL